MRIREMHRKDWPEVSRIYAEGIATGMATFETEVPDFESWDKAHIPSCRLVAADVGSIAGWAALSAVSGRCVYGGVAEVSVYVGERARGRGVGKLLLEQLIINSEAAGIWTLQAGIFPPNSASIRLHERLGFRQIGFREKIGKLRGIWMDNLIFERRSKKVGL